MLWLAKINTRALLSQKSYLVKIIENGCTKPAENK